MITKIFVGKNLFTPALTLCTLFSTYIIVKQELKDIYSFASQTLAFSIILILHKIFIISFTSTEKAIAKNNWLLLACNVIITAGQCWLIWNTLHILSSSSYLRDAMIYLAISAVFSFIQNILIKNYNFNYVGALQIVSYALLAGALYFNLFVNETRVYTLFLEITGLIVILFETVILFLVSQFYIDSHRNLDKSINS